ncbi:hypothetical protein [Curtobacterium sp. MCBD17_040]|uniref:hypothetical protein n=1 Tax=Curtobacterium sp. MCBD17_040 TaxID=2175674 RepID=UPI000DA7C96C|nr:hypothetical protein [Curtobacterium sp. MCBD17_040]WIB65898.1 hypothetical protein DEI94_17435 [Curtobacterium sp. MCBD17_040]
MSTTTDTAIPYVVIARGKWGEDKRHFLATDGDDARNQYIETTATFTNDVVTIRPAAIDDAPWTIARCSPTDDPTWWRMDEPCDYDKGEQRTCHHPVHAFGEPGPLRHLIDAESAELAAKLGWWS